MSQQALLLALTHPAAGLSFTSSSVTSPASGPRASCAGGGGGWGTRVLGQALWSPRLFLEASTTSTNFPFSSYRNPRLHLCPLCLKGKQSPLVFLSLQKCKKSSKC